jgi:hypothetical protein
VAQAWARIRTLQYSALDIPKARKYDLSESAQLTLYLTFILTLQLRYVLPKRFYVTVVPGSLAILTSE